MRSLVGPDRSWVGTGHRMTPGSGPEDGMRMELDRIAQEITPLLEVHGVELVAIDWLQGPGHGILRIFIDLPNGDPRKQDPATSIGLEEITNVTRDVSTAMDALDLIEGAYTLEVGSPGTQRPLQKRADFDRFTGLAARVEMRGEAREKHQLNGTLRGTKDLPTGDYAVRLEVAGQIVDIVHEKINRARLHEIAEPKKEKPGKGPSRRQDRIAARERDRAINAAHRAGLSDRTPDHTPSADQPGANDTAIHSDTTEHEQPNPATDVPRAAKR